MTDDAFDAFISYNHAADGRLATELRNGLQKFAKPWNQRRAMRVFLDRSSLELTAGLGDALQEKLGGASYLILLASAESAASPWCNEEARFWVENKGPSTLLLVLTDENAEIIWDDEAGRFDVDRSTALPPALLEAYPEEPLWLNMAWVEAQGEQAALDLRSPQFRDAVATLSATIQGKKKDELDGEDVRQHARFKRIRSAAIVMLALLTVLAVGFAFAALNSAANERQKARESELRALAADARSELAIDIDQAYLGAQHAFAQLRSDEFGSGQALPIENAVLEITWQHPDLRWIAPSSQILQITEQGQRLLVVRADYVDSIDGSDGVSPLSLDVCGDLQSAVELPTGAIVVATDTALELRDPALELGCAGSTGTYIDIYSELEEAVEVLTVPLPRGAATAPSSTTSLVSTGTDGVLGADDAGQVWFWNLEGPVELIGSLESTPAIAVSPDAGRWAAGAGRLLVFDAASGRVDHDLELPESAAGGGPISAIEFLDERRLVVAVTAPDTTLFVVDPDTEEWTPVVGRGTWRDIHVADDTGRLIAVGRNPTLTIGDLSCGTGPSFTCTYAGVDQQLDDAGREMLATAVAPLPGQESFLIATASGKMLKWSTTTHPLVRPAPAGTTFGRSPDAWTDRQTAAESALATLPDIDWSGAVVSPDGSLLAATYERDDGTVPVIFWGLRDPDAPRRIGFGTAGMTMDGRPSGVRWSPTGQWLVIASDEAITIESAAGLDTAIYDNDLTVIDGTELFLENGHAPGAEVAGWVFSADEHRIFTVASIGRDQVGNPTGTEVIGWDVAAGRQLAGPLRLWVDEPTADVAGEDAVADHLLFRRYDGSLRTLPIGPDAWAAYACELVPNLFRFGLTVGRREFCEATTG